MNALVDECSACNINCVSRKLREPYYSSAKSTTNSMQIVTGIEVNSEAYFPKVREYCPSAEGTWAIFPQLREVRLTIDR